MKLNEFINETAQIFALRHEICEKEEYEQGGSIDMFLQRNDATRVVLTQLRVFGGISEEEGYQKYSDYVDYVTDYCKRCDHEKKILPFEYGLEEEKNGKTSEGSESC